MILAIVAAEVLFWVFLLGGLALRYIVRAQRASTIALTAVPLVDAALLTFVMIDVASGAPPTQAHALAAIYLGFTIAFGHSMVAWADARFRHRFADGPKPKKPRKGSRAEVKALWLEWFRAMLASGIAVAMLGLMLAIEGSGIPQSIDAAAEHPYWATMVLLGTVVGIWFLAGPAFAGRGKDHSQDARQPERQL
ncbi:hypothetical protein ACIQTW_20200 [Paenarthrobacter sp. NPDC090517]|uniref:hypothetical protein n=1 Tax=Paenarthrobacter sp. NPDC090517 TaxID=3364381 RepID=UPI00382F688C